MAETYFGRIVEDGLAFGDGHRWYKASPLTINGQTVRAFARDLELIELGARTEFIGDTLETIKARVYRAMTLR